MKPYPIFLVGLEKKRSIVIGGSDEAEFKVKGLLECGANLTVIAPRLTEELHALAQNGEFVWIARDYRPGDLKGAFFVLAERFTPLEDCRIWAEGLVENCLVNVMDDIPRCNFVAGSVIRQGPLAIAISTSGAAPAFSVRLRQKLQNEFGPEYKTYLDWLQSIRPSMKQTHPSFQKRKERWYDVVDSEILELIRADKLEDARNKLQAITEIKELPDEIQVGELTPAKSLVTGDY
ncbi:MAG: bifunctional precorrin-2 dehydrogenase/sirohydrochlorin ferrochelatase [Anaerolineae bacterium]